MLSPRFWMALRIGLCGILTWSAFAKLNQAGAPSVYADWIDPHSGWHWGVFGFELTLAVWILLGVRLREASLLVVVLLSALTAILCVELTKAEPKECGCFGGGTAVTYAEVVYSLIWSIARNMLLLIAGSALFFRASVTKHVNSDTNSDLMALTMLEEQL